MSWFKFPKMNWNVVQLIWTAMLSANPSVKLWALILGLPPVTGILIWVIYTIQRPWRGGHEADQIHNLFIIAESLIGIIAIGFVTLAAVKFGATGPGGFGLSIDGATPSDPNTRTIETVSRTTEKSDIPIKTGV